METSWQCAASASDSLRSGSSDGWLGRKPVASLRQPLKSKKLFRSVWFCISFALGLLESNLSTLVIFLGDVLTSLMTPAFLIRGTMPVILRGDEELRVWNIYSKTLAERRTAWKKAFVISIQFLYWLFGAGVFVTAIWKCLCILLFLVVWQLFTAGRNYFLCFLRRWWAWAAGELDLFMSLDCWRAWIADEPGLLRS